LACKRWEGEGAAQIKQDEEFGYGNPEDAITTTSNNKNSK
jgi:hypothetical protein